MDKIFINGLEILVLIGVHPHERTQKQSILLDIELGVDISKAIASDSIAQTIDYDFLIHQIKTHASHTNFLLIESLAEDIAQFILKNFNVLWLRLCLSKPGAAVNVKKIGITIERTPF